MKSMDELRRIVEKNFSQGQTNDLARKISGFVKLAFDHPQGGIDCLFCGMPTIFVDGIYRDAMQKTGLIEKKPRPSTSAFYHLTPKAYEYYKKALNGTTRIKIQKSRHSTYS